MYKLWLLILAMITITSCKKNQCEDGPVPGEVIIEVLDNESPNTVDSLVVSHGLSIESTRSGDDNWYLIIVPEGEEEEWIEVLEEESIIELAERNQIGCIH